MIWHFDCRISFERTWGALELGIVTPESGLSYPALRETLLNGEVRALIAVKPDEWPRLECGFREIDRFFHPPEKGRVIHQVLKGNTG